MSGAADAAARASRPAGFSASGWWRSKGQQVAAECVGSLASSGKCRGWAHLPMDGSHWQLRQAAADTHTSLSVYRIPRAETGLMSFTGSPRESFDTSKLQNTSVVFNVKQTAANEK